MLSEMRVFSLPRLASLAVGMLAGAMAGWAACRVTPKDEPLNGRMLAVGNEHVEIVVAPQHGGRLISLHPVGGPEFLRSEADYAQARDSVACGRDSKRRWIPAVNNPANAEILTSDGETAAILWRTDLRDGTAALTVTRRVVVRKDSSTVFFEAVVRNGGVPVAPAAAYHLGLRLALSDDIALTTATETLNTDALKGKGLRRTFPPGASVAITRDRHCLTVEPPPEGTLALYGWVSILGLDCEAPAKDLAPGETTRLRLAFRLAKAPEEDRDRRDEINWDLIPVKGRDVAPLIVPDTPPADLPPTPIAVQHGRYGVHLHSSREYLPLWAAAGVRWLRGGGFGWDRIEPRQGQYDFSQTDALLGETEAMGLRIIGLLYGSPAWAARNGKVIDPPNDLGAWERFVETVVRRYKGRVNVWEVWNEPDIGEFWSGSAEDYVALLKAACAGAKRADPHCLVVSAGLDGPGERFLQRIVQLGAAEHCDLIGFHPYAATPDASEKRMRAVWRILNFYHIRKPVWVTEVGWQSGGWKGGPGVVADEEIKARHLSECYERLRSLAEVVCWYADMEAGQMYGLVRPSGSGAFDINPAYHAFEAAARRAQPATIQVDMPGTISVTAGQSATLKGRIKNVTAKPVALTARVVGLPAAQLRLAAPSTALPPGAQTEVELAIAPPIYALPGKRAALLAWFARRHLAGHHWLTIDLRNHGPSSEVRISDGWVKRLDKDGKEISPLRPRSEFCFAPGDAFRQSLKLTSCGSADETFAIAFSGEAGPWAAPASALEVPVAAGKEAWAHFDVCVPAGLATGSYSLAIVAVSRAHPDLRREHVIRFAVGGPE